MLRLTISFSRLDNHLAERASYAMSTALASSKSDSSVGSKGSAGGKRKPTPGSRGVEQLKKVNTGGMSKLTSFFKPKEGKK